MSENTEVTLPPIGSKVRIMRDNANSAEVDQGAVLTVESHWDEGEAFDAGGWSFSTDGEGSDWERIDAPREVTLKDTPILRMIEEGVKRGAAEGAQNERDRIVALLRNPPEPLGGYTLTLDQYDYDLLGHVADHIEKGAAKAWEDRHGR